MIVMRLLLIPIDPLTIYYNPCILIVSTYLLNEVRMKATTTELQEIASMRAAGTSLKEIAKNINVHESTISRRLNTQEMQEMLEREREEFLKCVPQARQNLQKLVMDHDDLPADSQDKQRAWKTSIEIARAAGMLPSHAPSIYIQTLYQDNSTTVLAPEVSQFLDHYTDDVIEVESDDIQDIGDVESDNNDNSC